MSDRKILTKLKKLDFENLYCSLAVVRSYKRKRIAQYICKYVQINEILEKRLKSIVSSVVQTANTVNDYEFDCPEPEADEARVISYKETDFHEIFKQLQSLNPEEDIIENVEELVKANSYVIIIRNAIEIQAVGFKSLPENWKMKKAKGLIPLMYKNNRFEALETNSVFSIAKYLDFIYYSESLFILSKKSFETGLNFRDGMIAKSEEFFAIAEKFGVFENLETLRSKVGNNLRYLRKIATVMKLGHYKDKKFMKKLESLSEIKKWPIQFNGERIIITEDSLDDILTLLQNKRLYSELTEEDFDVESAKKLSISISENS